MNWNPTQTTVDAVKDAPPVDDVLANKYNDWAVISFLKCIEKMTHLIPSLPDLVVDGKYDQATAQVVDDVLAMPLP